MNRYQLRRRSWFQAAAFYAGMAAICSASALGFASQQSPMLACLCAALAVPHTFLALECACKARLENRRDRATRNTYL